MTVGTESYSKVVRTAQEYYDSDDAEAYYTTIWGGENINSGPGAAPRTPWTRRTGNSTWGATLK
jgi:hypothetical protein